MKENEQQLGTHKVPDGHPDVVTMGRLFILKSLNCIP